MKVLYGIQGTGHGHVSRAREILPELSKLADVDVLMSGTNCRMTVDGQRVARRRGLSLTYDSRGAVSYLKTAMALNPIRFLRDVQSLHIADYDLVISDFEPITSWAAITSRTPCIGLSHQAAFLSDRTPRPHSESRIAEYILKYFAPCHKHIGFHFLRYDRFIEGPIIRSDVRNLNPTQGDHISVYLPAFDPETLVSIFNKFRQIKWEVFSPLCDQTMHRHHITVHPVGNEPFLRSMESCAGVVTSAGFETCAEAIYLGKKLLAIPIKNQYEQQCNAEALSGMGVTTASVSDPDFSASITKMLETAAQYHLPEIADAERIAKKLIRYASKMSGRSSVGLMKTPAYVS